MSDDLVQRLRHGEYNPEWGMYSPTEMTDEAADRIEQLEMTLKHYETAYRVSRVYPHEMPDGEVFGVPSFTDGKRIFPLLSDEYDLYVVRTSPEGKRND